MMKQNKKKGMPVKPNTLFEVKEQIELMSFLIDSLTGKSRQNVKRLLTNKQVEVNGQQRSQYNYLLHQGDKVKIKWMRQQEVKSFNGFSIVFEDEYLIVIDKHSGVLSVATNDERNYTAYNFLSIHVKREHPANKIFIVHRLDRETSGLMIYAKSAEVQHKLQDNWKELITERSYVAVTEGVFNEKRGVVSSYLHENAAHVVYSDQNPLGGKKAITHYEVLKSNRNYSLLAVKLETGRKNQIRVHMQDIGHSIINDKKYGSTVNPIDRLGLHSRILAFIHPVTGQSLRFTTPIPRKFMRLF